MLKGNKKYVLFLVLCFLALILLKIYSPKPIDWSQSYSKKDKIPYGTEALFSTLPELFPEKNIAPEKLPLYNVLKNNSYQNTNYVVINKSFEPDELDTKELLKYAFAGNNVFVAANYFSGKFADTLKLNTNAFYNFDSGLKIDSNTVKSIKQDDSVELNFSNPLLKSTKFYSFKNQLENYYLNSFDTTITSILGTNNKNQINFIAMKWGKGKIYIHTTPEVFTNYFFVDNTNVDYASKVLSYLPVSNIIWDEYYKVSNVAHDNMFRVLFANPALKTAYFVALISLLIFILIGTKRKQRTIPIIEPLRNTTLDFIGVVGTLYYQTGNHKNIADKKITYFLAHIRKTFQIKTTIYDDSFITRISILSGIEQMKVHDMFYFFDDISSKNNVTQQELIKLNLMIEEFHKYNKR